MARTIKPLTASQVEKAKPIEKEYNLFDDNGLIIIHPKLSDADCKLLGLHSSMKLRQVDEQHRKFLHWHRTAYQL